MRRPRSLETEGCHVVGSSFNNVSTDCFVGEGLIMLFKNKCCAARDQKGVPMVDVK